MKKKRIAAGLVAAAALLASGLTASGASGIDTYRTALDLYRNGMYERAQTLFESIAAGDPIADGYSVLCALKMRTDGYESEVARYRETYPKTIISPVICWERGLLLFDEGRYAEALGEFGGVDQTALTEPETAEYIFKCGYSEYSIGRYEEAAQFFTVLDALPVSSYTGPGRYLTGMMHYARGEFAPAEAAFWKASADPALAELTSFYIVDCEFNQKNYDFTIREGEKIFAGAPAGRRERLARMLSEAYLIKGDTARAEEYYNAQSREEMNRKDYFHAGSLKYASGDYESAIENYNRMGERRDSLGQIANYHLGYSYIRTRDQVAAMGAFLDASSAGFDPAIREDAAFNYAKLAFDLNKDTKGFSDYISRYSTKAKGEQIYSYMALAALQDGDYATAVEAYDSIDDLAPDMRRNYIKANFLRGEQLFKGGSYNDAVPYFKATSYYLPRTDKLGQFSRYCLAEAYYRSGAFGEAAAAYTELYNADALDGTAEGRLLPYNVGYSYFKQQKYSDAARWFDTYIRSGCPEYREDAMCRRADCDFGRRDYKAAVSSYQKVLAEFFSPDDIYPYLQQAISYGLTGDLKRKLAALKHVTDADPSAPLYADAWYELGRAQMDAKDYNGAAGSFSHLRDNTSDRTYIARALIGLGMVQRNRKNYDASLESYKTVVSMVPGSQYAEESMLAIESIYQTLRQPEKFLQWVEENSLTAGKSAAEKEKIYFNTAEQLYLAGNYAQAIPQIQKYLEMYPAGEDRAQAVFYLAESYSSTGEKEKALDYYLEAVEKSSADFSFAEVSRLRYASIAYSLERYQAAYDAYSGLLSTARMEPSRTQARIGMMRSAYRCKDYDNALTSCESVLGDGANSADVMREAAFVKAKSLLASSKRDEAMRIFTSLSAHPGNAEGAESRYMVIQNLYDTGQFDKVESEVYGFAQNAGEQAYWLAKAYIVLGDSFAERKQYAQAKATFESVRDGYEPASGMDDIAGNISMRLERLATLMEQN